MINCLRQVGNVSVCIKTSTKLLPTIRILDNCNNLSLDEQYAHICILIAGDVLARDIKFCIQSLLIVTRPYTAYHYEPVIARHLVTSSPKLSSTGIKLCEQKNVDNPSDCGIIADYSLLYYSILTSIILVALIIMSYISPGARTFYKF